METVVLPGHAADGDESGFIHATPLFGRQAGGLRDVGGEYSEDSRRSLMHSGRNRIEPMCSRRFAAAVAERWRGYATCSAWLPPSSQAFTKVFVESSWRKSATYRWRGLCSGVAIGALIDRQALAKIESHAVAKGRRIRCGGKRIARMARRTIGPVSSEMTIAQERDIRAAGACGCFDDADRSCMRPTTRSTAFPHICASNGSVFGVSPRPWNMA